MHMDIIMCGIHCCLFYRFHVDKLSSAHVYVRLHAVSNFVIMLGSMHPINCVLLTCMIMMMILYSDSIVDKPLHEYLTTHLLVDKF